MSERKTFNHYKSFWEIKKLLNNKQYVEFDKMLCKVEFLEVHIDDVIFEDATLTILWVSVKHSVKKCIDGYVTKTKFNYNQLKTNEVEAPCYGSTNDLNTTLTLPSQQGEEEEKEQGEEKEQEQCRLENFLSLWKETPFKQIRSLTQTRKTKILKRLEIFTVDEIFESLLEQLNLKDCNWFDIDFLIKNDENCEKVINKKYKDMGKDLFNQPKKTGNSYSDNDYQAGKK